MVSWESLSQEGYLYTVQWDSEHLCPQHLHSGARELGGQSQPQLYGCFKEN